ncbi:MAG: threonine aldolase [Flavobacteriaceae bacterium]|nr:threonine aldolase [Flavobacteriaceae bacterium]
MIVNLISDTVTKPSKEMLHAMINAEVGDDVFKEDPSVNKLEEMIAKMFNKTSALFFPSGTMTNQVAIKINTEPGDELICDHYSHVYNYEGGGASFNSGVSCKLIEGDRGRIFSKQIQKNINKPDFYHSPKTSLVCLENTTNKGGGAIYDFNEIKKIRNLCDKHNLGLHLDGARLWNALVETNETAKDYGNIFDTISLCFSKGLGCPVGSILVGSEEKINKALRIRKVLGGGMRQSGYLASAAIFAIENQIDDLKNDHIKAKEIESVLKNLNFIKKVEPVSTNIIIFSLIDEVDETYFINKMKENNILIISLGEDKLRIVTHRDYTDFQHDYFLSTIQKIKI